MEIIGLLALYLIAGACWGYALAPTGTPAINNYRFTIENKIDTAKLSGPEKLLDPDVNHKLVDKVREAKKNLNKLEEKGHA